MKEQSEIVRAYIECLINSSKRQQLLGEFEHATGNKSGALNRIVSEL